MVNATAREELKLLYEVSVKDLDFFKRQQWLVSYYAVVLYAALFALSGKATLDKMWFYLVVCGVAIMASILLLNLEHSIGVRRDRLKAIRENFSEEFKGAWKAGKKLKEYHVVVYFMLFGVLAGAVLTSFGIAFPSTAP